MALGLGILGAPGLAVSRLRCGKRTCTQDGEAGRQPGAIWIRSGGRAWGRVALGPPCPAPTHESPGRPPAAVAAEATRNAVCLFRYLKEFRTEQCSLFVQHKCTQHRPFTCFHWHFLNQRRRRPLRRRDGTFNYSPDVYCSKYDEASGVCPDGDE